MDWLNYHHLLYFWTTARLGSVSRAAEELHLAQPTISAQLRSLEHALGHKLFVRRGRHLSLTESGQAVFRYAEIVCLRKGASLLEKLVHDATVDVGQAEIATAVAVRQFLVVEPQ